MHLLFKEKCVIADQFRLMLTKCFVNWTTFQRIVKFCDEMMASEWRPFHARPKYEVQGCFVIGRWFDQQKTWAILYIGQGCIRDLLESRFRASHKWSIGMYLSSFPKKALRKLIWIKWRKDPYYPREVWNKQCNVILWQITCQKSVFSCW